LSVKAIRVIAFGLVIVMLGLLPGAQTSFGQGRLSKATIAGHEVFVDGYARSDNNCQGLAPPQITIDDPPEHGIICLRRGDLWLKATIENNLAHCLGKKVSGFHVIYIARKDYTGPDHVHYTVVFPTVQHSMDVTLNVWPDSSKTSVATPGDISATIGETRQPSGPIPACPTLVS
jgi:hypothetical protein